MDASFLLNTVLNGVMNSRRKRSRRAKHYLTGRAGSLLSNPATLMTAAGLAWGVFESLQAQASAGKPGPAANPLVGMPPTPDVSAPDATPAVAPDATPAQTPDATADAARAALDPAALRMIRVVISAANADGALSERERSAILQQAAPGGAAELVEA